ncbi:bifunctional diguanylate cyclase/phosphodiesterase [Paenibacillus sp. R14(2021)]|uniref:putative bifunctional diguanylate cyclase/phosphodiesterase n=1 Tax=Paenibacillus sp. R14(2021) TaxID=2859228 RepID=UPI001C61361F|nr:EAL domain-containing protein [Paenibacillus sp. R14(2021)]
MKDKQTGRFAKPLVLPADVKPLLFIVLCAAVLVAGISVFSYSQSKAILKEKMTLATQQSVLQTVDKLTMILHSYEDLTYNFVTDAAILSYLADYGSELSGPMDRFTAAKRIKTTIAVRFFNKSDMTSVHLLPMQGYGQEISTRSTVVPAEQYMRQGWFEDASRANGRIRWLQTMPQGYLQSGVPSFAIARVVTLASGLKYMLVVEINAHALNAVLSETKLGDSGEMVLLNWDNRLLSSSRKAAIGERFYIPSEQTSDGGENAPAMGSRTVRQDGKLQLVATGRLNDAAWEVQAVVPMAELVRDTDKIRNTSLLSVLLIAVVTFLLNYSFQRRRSEAKIRYMAFHDHLTGLANRKQFSERLEREIKKSKLLERTFAVLFIDLDRLKIMNDTFGHGAGDKLLIETADKLRKRLAHMGLAARFGGDEFLVLMPQAADHAEIEAVAQDIITLLQQPVIYQDKELYVSASIGISLYPEHGEDAQTLIKNADMAMYSVKESGRSSYKFYEAAMDKKAYGSLSLERDLRKARERGQLQLFYQPQVELTTGRIIGSEALVRWNHHELGMVSPSVFIPIAEESRYIIPLGEWIMTTACRQNKAWQDAGLPKVKISVNLSIHQFQQNHIIDTVARILQETGLEPQYLELEITETIAMHDVTAVIRTLKGLSELGVKISIDDFGTGYSSLSYLKDFPIHRLKMDKAFLDNMVHSDKERAIVGAIIVMSHSLNLEVTAEGVESLEQAELLRQFRCDDAQGYVFSYPLLPEAYAQRLSEGVIDGDGGKDDGRS